MASMQTTNAPDGEQLAYEIHGRSGKTPLMTVHGLVSSNQHWPFFVPHFAQSRQVLAWDYRGHGGQPTPHDAGGVSIEQFARDAEVVWQAAKLGPAVVSGLSFGVQVALEVCRRSPQMVKALVLICGTAGHPLDRVSSSAMLRRSVARTVRLLASQAALAGPVLAFLRTPTGTRVARELAYLTGGAHRTECPPSVLEGLFGHVGALDPRLLGAITAGYLEHSAWDVLPTINVPTLIIAGDKDQLTPVSTAERMQRAVPGSELIVFRGHSHLVQVEKPREVHAAIDEFLSRRGL
jgi:pimeloyl-ACP methyl ester carboxylesterase